MIWPLMVAGRVTCASYFGVPVGAGWPPRRSRNLSRSGFAGLAAGLEISGSVPTQNLSGLDKRVRRGAARISRSPGAALVAMVILIDDRVDHGRIGRAVRRIRENFLADFARVPSRPPPSRHWCRIALARGLKFVLQCLQPVAQIVEILLVHRPVVIQHRRRDARRR